MSPCAAMKNALPGGTDTGPELPKPVEDPEKGRPDVVGSDPMGSHQLIIKAKFWASLPRSSLVRT
jgi:hypothetical protein